MPTPPLKISLTHTLHKSTQRLYSYMKDVYGKKVITGQYCDGGLNGTEFKAIKSATGQTPAMLGLDFMRYTPCRVQNGDTSDAVEKGYRVFHGQEE